MFDKLKDNYKNFMNPTNEEVLEGSVELEGHKSVSFIKKASSPEHERRLFDIAFYCHHSLEKEQITQLQREWEEYYYNGKLTSTPILPYYYYILERIEFNIK